jgi:hypothetical protein
MEKRMKHKRFLKGVGFVGIAVVAAFVVGCIVMLLWNALVPELFNGPAITYWQAVGLLVLSHVLFRACGHHGHHCHRDGWLRRFEHRYSSLTPEEREKLRETLRERWGHPHDDREEKNT